MCVSVDEASVMKLGAGQFTVMDEVVDEEMLGGGEDVLPGSTGGVECLFG